MQPELIGYADRFSVAPGETIRFMISTDLPEYEASIVRLIHGDQNPKGPGFKEKIIDTSISGKYRGRKQVAYPGSYVLVQDVSALKDLRSFTLQAWIYPTTPANGKLQGLVTRWSREGTGYGMFVREDGSLELRVGTQRISTDRALCAREWYFIAATYDAESQRACLYQSPVSKWMQNDSAMFEKSFETPSAAGSNVPLLMGAAYAETIGDHRVVGRGLYNGKLENPRIFARALAEVEIESLRRSEKVDEEALVAAWDFAAEISSDRIIDRLRNGFDGIAVNSPTRAMTGHNWSGREFDFKHAPEEYGAIHFHEDDLDDARWEPDFELNVTDEFKSGVYAARLTSDEREDYVPFFVRPRRGTATAKIVYLFPTMTYLAYGNDRMQSAMELETRAGDRNAPWDPYDRYLAEHPELAMSIYDRHSDGSGCCYSSRLRPIVNMRPTYRLWMVSAPRHFSADLYLVDWMEQKGFEYDVITDEDLHLEGQELLSQYRLVLTGTHPEYWTSPMLNALEGYLGAGGRLMYLGGNGFYWATSASAERPHIAEVRRGYAGSRAWDSAPGELYHSSSGEMGGIWRHLGRAPNKVAGIGFAAMGWDNPIAYYMRQPGSFDERAAFIFEGIGEDEPIGNFGLVMNGAAGDELDRFDPSLGSPVHALVLASSTNHSPVFVPVIEEFTQITANLFEIGQANIHADMVYFEMPNDGAVFSTGSICWCGSLSYNNYDNNVSRITENVLRKFMT